MKWQGRERYYDGAISDSDVEQTKDKTEQTTLASEARQMYQAQTLSGKLQTKETFIRE
jgi:hypothetical protein